MKWVKELIHLRSMSQLAFTCLLTYNGDTRTMSEICSKSTIKTTDESRQRPDVLIVKSEQISRNCSGVSIVDFEQVNIGWGSTYIETVL